MSDLRGVGEWEREGRKQDDDDACRIKTGETRRKDGYIVSFVVSKNGVRFVGSEMAMA